MILKSYFFQYHFVTDAFEKERVDGTRKLKLFAIPTIFGELVTQIPNQQKKRKTGKAYFSISYLKIELLKIFYELY